MDGFVWFGFVVAEKLDLEEGRNGSDDVWSTSLTRSLTSPAAATARRPRNER
jgi:hypothetical protein